jgi:signal transduction histidine kinase/AmiR/NasT family two-component response regulator
VIERATPASVLIIDDDADFRSVVREELSHAGYVVSEAGGGEEGIERLRNEDVDVLVLDVQMPDKNGCEVLREARDMGVKSEVVVITAYPELDIAMECLRAGVFDLIEKPFAARMLLGSVSHAAERGRLQRKTALYQATREIFAAHAPERLPQVIVETAVRALEADDASLMIPDGTGALTIAYSNGLPAALHNTVRLRIGEGIAGKVAQERTPALLIGAAGSDPRFAGARGEERVRSSIVYPLASGVRLVGVLNVNRTKKQKPFREADVDLAAVFASQCLLALENVGLLRRVMRTERLAFLGRLAADLSHEVANPTSFIIANLEFLRQNLPGEGPLGEDLVASAEEALQGARRIAKVVQDMRSVVRGEEPAHVRVDVSEAMRFAIRMSAQQLEGVRVETELGEDLFVLGDEARLGQVFLNLLVNAGQALAGRRDARVRVVTEREGTQVRASVSDNGPGIPVRDQGRIFDAFFTTKPPGAGSGLGLSIGREIVRRHGGELTVESEEGRGSRFIVTLPAAG